MAKRKTLPSHRTPCEDIKQLGDTVADITTSIRLLSENQTRTDKAINRLTEALSTMAQHDGRLNHLEAESSRCHEHSTLLWQEVKALREATNKGISLAETALERGRNHSSTLRQIVPWGTAIIMAAATVGLLLTG
jgi:predicted nuclease with TOPRIM domain